MLDVVVVLVVHDQEGLVLEVLGEAVLDLVVVLVVHEQAGPQ